MKKIHGYVCSYINPDTDGVCTALAYCHYRSKFDYTQYVPVLFGELDAETEFVLRKYGVTPSWENVDSVSSHPYVLVDTHHVAQLPQGFPVDRVEEIIDHHPAGDTDQFVNARVQNEAVGAAATLLTERISLDIGTVPRDIAGLLCSAIVSNTLNFTAPTTSNRDVSAFEWLMQFCDIDDAQIKMMFKARSNIEAISTYDVLVGDFKMFSTGGVAFGISQHESTDTQQLLVREDLSAEMTRLSKENCLDHYLLNAVDIVQQSSTLVCQYRRVQTVLGRSLDIEFFGNVAQCNRILLRKSDLVPALNRGLSEEE